MADDDIRWNMPQAPDTMNNFDWLSGFDDLYPLDNWLENDAASFALHDKTTIDSSTNQDDSNIIEANKLVLSGLDECTGVSTLYQATSQEDATTLRQQYRSLPRRRSKYLLRKSGSQTRPVAIPSFDSNPGNAQSFTMQRWRNSPPQDEGASLSAIYYALESSSESLPQDSLARQADPFRSYRTPPSVTSIGSATSASSLQSSLSSQSAASTTSQPNRAPRKRERKKNTKVKMDVKDRIFKCTFCCDTFKHKYDWARHEESLHLSTREWRCAPHGGSVLMSSTGRIHCAYCNALDPTTHHLEEHNYYACRNNDLKAQTFRRKDHLVQHLRLVHHVDTLPLMDDWKVELSSSIMSRCGFCDETLTSWAERSNHLAAHFRKGMTMADWSGEHEFDPLVAARVTNAIPPYMIAIEYQSAIPYSATDPGARDHYRQMASRIDPLALPSVPQHNSAAPVASNGGDLPSQQEIETLNFSEMLTHHLSRFARQQMSMGIIPTDEMFQRESRKVMYDDEDPLNYTIADNTNWLGRFRQRNQDRWTGQTDERNVN